MKAYKNYLILIETANYDGWCIYETQDQAEAVKVYEGLFFPSEVTAVELFGTDEDPDTYLTGETIRKRGAANGTAYEIL